MSGHSAYGNPHWGCIDAVRRCPPVRVDPVPQAVQCDTRHMTIGHARQKGGSS
jgi:hypothetical protein